MTDWPSTLPQAFSKDGFQRSMADNVIRSQMEYGAAKLRRRTAANVSNMSGDMIMSDAQIDTLETFYKDTLAAVLSFDFPDPHGGSALSVRFKSPPAWVPRSPGKWRVSLAFEILP